MNKKNLLLTVLFAISATQAMLPAEPNQPPKGWGKLCKSYATSLISGGLIGSATGILSVQAIARSINGAVLLTTKPDNTGRNNAGAFVFGLIVPTVILIAENRLRSTLTHDINQNFEENAINHNKNLIRDTAWIASWIAFLSCINFEA